MIFVAMEFHSFGPATVYLIMFVLCLGIVSLWPYLMLYVWVVLFY